MSSSESFWTSRELVVPLLVVALSFLLAGLNTWWRERSRRRAHWAALSAEIEHCRHLAGTYLRDPIAAPLHRLPTMAYTNSLPSLLADAALNETDTRSLLLFFNEVETLNRGLDQAEGARLITDTTERDNKLGEEFNRNRLKAKMLVPSSDSRFPSYYDNARSVLESRLRRYML